MTVRSGRFLRIRPAAAPGMVRLYGDPDRSPTEAATHG
jgi:hypothetical protein